MKLKIILFAFTALVLVSCSNYGESKKFDGLDIYYSESVPVSRVDALGAFLQETGFTDGKEKSIQIDKNENGYLLKMVILEEYINSEDYVNTASGYGQAIKTAVFEDSLMELHFCDQYFETKKTIKLD